MVDVLAIWEELNDDSIRTEANGKSLVDRLQAPPPLSSISGILDNHKKYVGVPSAPPKTSSHGDAQWFVAHQKVCAALNLVNDILKALKETTDKG